MKPGVKVEFGFGVELRADGRPLAELATGLGVKRIIQHAAEQFGGGTLYATRGDWINSKGKHCREDGRTLVVYINPKYEPQLQRIKIDDMVACIKKQLDQEAVAVCITNVTTGIL